MFFYYMRYPLAREYRSGTCHFKGTYLYVRLQLYNLPTLPVVDHVTFYICFSECLDYNYSKDTYEKRGCNVHSGHVYIYIYIWTDM